jgi:hypothetical protein
LFDGIGFFYPFGMSCRIAHIKPPCGYIVEGVEQIWLLDFDDFGGYKFYEDGNYEKCYVEEILQSGTFKELDAPDLVAKYSSTGNYAHRLETFVGALNSSTLSSLHLATKRRQVVLFKTNSQQYFTFGYEAGAAVSYANQTNEGFGSAVTLTSNSIYPLFEYTGAIPNDDEMGGETIYDIYPDDAAAALDGVPLNGLYELSTDNIYGLPEGILKRRKI